MVAQTASKNGTHSMNTMCAICGTVYSFIFYCLLGVDCASLSIYPLMKTKVYYPF